MEILISMKSGDSSSGFENPYMNSASSTTDRYFIAEIRDSEEENIDLLQKFSDILLKKLNDPSTYSVENTTLGFKLLKKVDNNKNYTDDWDDWVEFSNQLHEDLEDFFNS